MPAWNSSCTPHAHPKSPLFLHQVFESVSSALLISSCRLNCLGNRPTHNLYNPHMHPHPLSDCTSTSARPPTGLLSQSHSAVVFRSVCCTSVLTVHLEAAWMGEVCGVSRPLHGSSRHMPRSQISFRASGQRDGTAVIATKKYE